MAFLEKYVENYREAAKKQLAHLEQTYDPKARSWSQEFYPFLMSTCHRALQMADLMEQLSEAELKRYIYNSRGMEIRQAHEYLIYLTCKDSLTGLPKIKATVKGFLRGY